MNYFKIPNWATESFTARMICRLLVFSIFIITGSSQLTAQTAIPNNSEFDNAITGCLAEQPVTGLCTTYGTESGYGTMPNWDTSSITQMNSAFRNKNDFNGDISGWNTSSVTHMDRMFEGTGSFSQDIRTTGNSWIVVQVQNFNRMFESSAMVDAPLSAPDLFNNNPTSIQAYKVWFASAPDSTGPSMTITAAEVADGATSNDTTLALTFEAGEVTTNFAEGDITVDGGNLSNFAANVNGTTYTATFTPTGDGATTIDVGAGTFTDASSNDNTAATQFNWTFDSTGPSMTITAAEVADGSTSNDTTLALTFEAGEVTTNFAEGDITVDGGNLSNFAANVNGTTYTATFTPTGDGATTIDVGAGTFTDASSNDNTAATQFNWTFDSTGPSMTITAAEVADGATSNDTTLALTFEAGEVTTNFAEGDITVDGGNLSNFAANVNGTTYTATFTPTGDGATTIDVGAGTFTDASSNDNTAATQFNWTFDSTGPSMTITAAEVADGATSNDTTLALTFEAGEVTTNFAEGDITVDGGNLSNFAANVNGTTYTATFTPTGDGATTIDVGAGTFTDASSNDNTAATQFNWTFDSTGPSMTITAAEVADGSTSNDTTLALTFEAGEVTTNFAEGDITVDGGNLSNFAANVNGTTYTATFTPTGDGATTIDVGAGTFTDASSNDNTAATQFNWTFDSTGPSMTITAAEVADGATSNDTTLALTFEAGEVTTNFAEGDITVDGGNLSNFAANVNGTTYTATFTPTGDGATTIDVGAGTFTDASSNDNTAATQFNWTFDSTGPSMTITAAEVADGSTSNDTTLALTFEAGEVTTNFAEGDITVDGGNLSNFAANVNGTTYTATFTPTGDGATTIDVGAGTFTDASSNDNTAATQFNWTFDSTGPSMTITAAEVADGATSNDTTLALTFEAGEVTTNFAEGDITVDGGNLSNFAANVNGTTYTATFTPTGDGATTIDVGAGTFTDASSNDNTAATQFNWTFDSTGPSMTITAAEVADGSTSNDTTLALTFEAGEVTTNFAEGDITVDGGNLSNFAANVNGTTYTATFTPTGDGATTIDVGAGTFTDASSNDNTAATQFNWTFDSTGPSMTITAAEVADGATSNDTTLALTFEAGEVTTNFAEGDITVDGGNLSNFAANVNGTTYTATFTPTGDGATTIDVGAGTFTDASSNDNTAATQFNWTFDSTGPSMTITAAEVADGATSNDTTLALTFEAGEVTTNFAEGDITVDGGNLSNFAANVNGTTYTATFTPTGDGATTIDVGAGTFTDASSNDNTAATQFNWTFDSTGPSMTITAAEVADGSTSNDTTLALTFEAGEVTTNFAEGDITVDGGNLSNFAANVNGTTYTATFTPTGDGATTIDVGAGTFTDASSNDNTAATQFNWTFDSTGPSMTITAAGVADGATSNDTTLALTFEAGEVTTNFAEGDITVDGGNLSNFAANVNGTTYTATFTPTGDGATTIDVGAGTFTDASSNDNTAATQFNWTFDSTGPSMTITAAEVADGSTSNDTTLALTFEAGEVTTNFAEGDITVDGGNLSNFAANVNGTTYTATFTPTGDGATTIDVGAGTFTDASSNDNTAATQFNWTFDSTGPSMTITAAGVADGATSNDTTLALTFEAGEVTTNFAEGDITVDGGNLSNFAANVNGTTYTATFTPTGDGATTIDVGAGTFTDASSNDNTAATQFNWTFDSTGPSMTITAAEVADGSTSNDTTLALTFEAGEVTTNFAEGDITVDGGNLSNFAANVNGTTYTATFTPTGDGATTIDVGAGTFTDASSNDNTAATQFNWTFDSTGPSMTITAAEVADGATSNDTTLALTFEAGEVTTNFAEGDITVDGGNLSNFAANVNGTTYTATFTPTGDGATTIDVGAGTFTDASSNDNTAATQFNWTFDSTGPSMTITAAEVADGSTSNDTTLALTFEAGEVTTNFAEGDITVDGGNLSNFAANVNGTTYTATFTPTGDGATTIDVGAGTFTDASSNDNTAATQFNWTFDSTGPSMTITAAEVADGSTSNDTTLALTFEAGEVTTNFAEGDITVDGGNLSNFAANVNGTTYTATFTPTGDGATTIDVGAGTFTDASSNDNTAATQFNWTFDSTGPSMTITAAEVADGATSNDTTLALTFEAGEVTTNFAEGDITVDGGNLSNFAANVNGTTYTATFTPTGDGATTIDVGAGTFTDASSNDNTAATQFNWTFDSTGPSMTITAAEVADGSTSNDTTLALTFEAGEVTTNFAEGDITVDGGNLSNFAANVNGTTYTATFTPTGDGATTIDVGAGTFTDASSNDNTAATQFNWTFDSTGPSMTITAAGVADGATSNDTTLALTFEAGEVTTNFAEGDITVDGGNLSNFAANVNGTTYTATFTPTGDGATTIDVGAGTFTDASSNDNTAATQFNWTFDSTGPSMTITAAEVADGSTSNDTTLALTFEAGEVTTNFAEGDITVDGGNLSNFAANVNGTTYTATFTPTGDGATTIDVGAGTFTDASSNDNTAATQFNWTFDSTGPSMTITAAGVADGATSNDTTLALTFEAGEVTTNFAEGDITVDGGNLSNFAANVNGTTYTATFTPTGDGATTIDVGAGTFTDASSNDNTAATQFNWTFDSTGPSMTITAAGVADGSTSNDTTLALTFEAGEVTTNFAEGDITVDGGNLSNFAANVNGTTYTATFTPTGDGATTIDVGAGTFTDASSNDNTAATQFNWTFDSTGPSMTITAAGVADGATSNDTTLALTFEAGEVTTNFAEGDITVDGGNLSNFAANVNGTTYTATFTPTGDGATTIDVGAGTFTDASSNDNTAATQFNWTFDSTGPSMTITAAEVADGSTSNDTTLALTFEAGEVTTNFAEGDITLAGGNLSNFAANVNGTTYTATFTPTGDGATTIDVGAGTFTDASSNDNTAATQFNWTFDSTGPSMTITAAEVADGSTSNDTTLALTFEAGEVTTNFAEGDITLAGGNLSNFAANVNGTTYTATFTPTGDGATTIDVGAGTFTDASSNDNTAATQFNWTFDSTGPSMTITAAGVADGATSNDTTLALTFEAGEVTTNFAEGDITLAGGNLSNFAANVNGTTYTATFTPTGDGATTIDVGAGTFTDASSNDNTAATQFNWTFDSTGPSMTITAAEVADGSTSNDTTLALTFEAGEVTTNFAEGDITLAGGNLSNFAANVNGTTYTATFTPTGDGATTIDVGAGTFTDASSNDNTAATQFNWTFDSTGPSMTITAAGVADGATSNDTTLALTFEAGEVTTNFAEGDITLAGGNLSNFAANVNGTTYTATFTPTGDGATTIDVGAGTFTDASSNDNTAATQFNWTFDSTGPTVGSVAVPSNGSYKEDGVLNFIVNTTEAVNVVGTPQIAVTVGSTAREAAYVADASTSTALLFRYTVVAGDTDTDGVLVGTLGLNGGTIKDAAENALNLTLNTVGATISVLVDTTAPTLSDVGIASDNESPTVGNIRDNVILFFTASETIGQPTVTFQSGGAAIADTSITYDNTAGTTWTASYAIDTKDSLGDVSYEIIFSDLAGNAGDQNFERNGSVNLPPVTTPCFSNCGGPEDPDAPTEVTATYLVDPNDGGFPVTLVLQDANGAQLTDTSEISSVDVWIVEGEGVLSTNPTGTQITLTGDGDALYDFKVISLSDGTVAISSSVTTVDGVTHEFDNLEVEFVAEVTEQTGTVDIVRQPALSGNTSVVTGGLLATQPKIRLLDSDGLLDEENNETVIEAYIIQGFGSLNGNGPETEVQVRGGVAEFDLLALTGDLITAGAEGEGYKLIFIANTPGENPKRYTSAISDVMKFNESLSDFTAPTVTTVDVPLPGSYREGVALNFTVHTSESLTVDTTGGTPQIAVTIGTDEAQAAYVSAGTSNELVFSYTVQAGETDTDGISVGALGLNGGTIKDFALNNMDPTLNTVGATTSVLVDTTAPTVGSVAVPSNGSYKEDGVLNFIVNTTEAVNVVGTPQIAVTVGSTAREAAYVADASTSTALLFRYTVVAGDTDTDGVLVGTLGLNGGTIKDAAENALNLTLNTVGATTSVLVDTTAPTVGSVAVPSNGSYKEDGVLNFIVNTTEAVNVVGTPQIAVTVGSTAREAAYVADASTSTALLFRYTVVAGDTDTDGVLVGTLGLNGGTIKDAAENALNLTLNTVGATTSVLVDTTAPTLSDVGIASDNESPTVGNIRDNVILFFTASETIGQPTVTFQSGGAAIADTSITYDNTAGTTWTASYAIDTKDSLGDVSYEIIFSDLAGNAGDQNFERNGSVNLPPVTTPCFSNCGGPEDPDAPTEVTATYLVDPNDGGFPVTLVLQDANGAQLTDTSEISSVDVWIVEGEGVLSTNPTGTQITLTGDGDALYDFKVISLSDGTVAISSSVTTVDGVTHEFDNLEVEFVAEVTEQTGTVDIVRQPALSGNTSVVTGGLLATQPKIRLLDSDGLLDEENNETVIEAYIIQGFGSLNGNGPETEVQVRGGVAEFDLLALTGDLITAGAEGEGYKLIFIANTPGENPKRYTSAISDVMKFNESLSDFTAPTVTTVDVPLPGSYREGVALNFTVHTSESLTVDTTGGTPQIAVTIGTDEAQAAYVSAGTSNELVFSYTVQAGETDTDGISVGALGLNGGTIKDFALNNMDPTLNTVGATTSVLVDTTAPTLSDVGIASDNESPTVGNIRDNVILFFTASETIGQPTVTFQSGGAAIADTSITYDNTAGTTWTASYAIDTKDSLGDVSYEIIFSDLAGNAGDQSFERNGSVNLPPVTNPDFECTTCTGIEAPLGELIAYSIYDGGIPVQVVLKDAEGAILTDLSKIQEVTVELISGVGTLTTNPTGTSIILPNDGDAIFDFQVLSSSPGQITMGASVTTTDGVRHNLDTLTVEFSADPEAAIGSVEILTQPALGQRNLLLTGGLFLNQPVVRLLDSNGNLKSSDNSTVVTARIISGNGSLNANGPETQVQVVNGIATFAGLSISALNNNPDQVYTLLFSAIDHIPARSEEMRYVDALTVDLTAPGSTTDGSFIVTAKFSNAVTGLSISHITVPTSEGTVTELSGSEKSYEFTVDPIPGKTVKITIPAGVVQDSAGNMNFASNTLSVQAGAPGAYFDENKDEIRSVIVELEQRLLQNKLTTNQKMMQDARARFIACRRQNDAGKKRNATPCKNQFLDFDGVAELDDGDFMTKGTFLERKWSKDGVENRMAFGDFDIQSYKNGSTTSSINGRLVWERYKYDNAMFGRYISGTFGVSKLRGIFEGTQRRYGVGAGAYFVAQLDEALFGDAHISGHLVKNSFSMEDGTLSLDGDYLTRKFTVGGALTGVIEYEGFELRPELAYNYGKTFIGNVDLNGQSWGLTDSGLKLDSEIVSVSRITLRPEFYFSAAEFLDLGDNAMFTFSPRYICERLSPNEATQSCGQGFEFGFSNQSDDGLMKISISYQVDHLHNDKTSTLEFSFGLNF